MSSAQVDDGADLVVVDALGDRDRERREDPRVGEPADRGVLDRPQVLAAVPAVRRLAEAVELEVDLDPIAELARARARNASSRAIRMPLVLRMTRVTLRSVAARMRSRMPGWTVGSPPDSIRASTWPPSRAIAASSDPQDVRAPARAGRRPGALTAKHVGHSRLQVSVTSIRTHAAVLGLEVAEAVEVAHRDRAGVGRAVGDDLAGRDPPLLEVLPERDVLLVQARRPRRGRAGRSGAGRRGRPSPRGCPGGCPSRSRCRGRGPR